MSVLESILRFREQEEAKARADVGMISNAFQNFQQSRQNTLLMDMEKKKLNAELGVKGLRFSDEGRIVPDTDLIQSLGLKKTSLADIMGGSFGGGDAQTATPAGGSNFLLDELSVPTAEGVDVKLKRKKTDEEFKKETQRKVEEASALEKIKPPSQAQETSALFAKRLDQAEKVFDKIGEVGAGSAIYQAKGPFNIGLPNWTKTGEAQSFEQAKRNFLNAVLRKESGAVISPSEFEEGNRQYFPQPGDKLDVLTQKKENRRLVRESFKQSGGKAYTADMPDFSSEAEAEAANLPKGTIITIKGERVRVD